jgi:hypothetical protein
MTAESPPEAPGRDGRDRLRTESGARRGVRDRDVVLVAAAVVAAVLALLALSVYVPAFGDVLALAPVLIVALVAITIVVLVRALRRGPPAAP